MKTVEEVRRERLAMLKEQVGSYAQMNRAMDLQERDSTLSQIGSQSLGSKTEKPKTMGSDLARKLEVVFHKPRGWMDTDPALVAGRWPIDAVSFEEFDALSPKEQGAVEEAMRQAVDAILRRKRLDGTHS